MSKMKCRHCNTELELEFVDLGTAPPSNSYLSQAALRQPEKFYPLRVLTCTSCWLVQTEDYANAEELFSHEYAYFSSFSTSWLHHAERYATDMIERFGLGAKSQVIEVASNDGYLLQYFIARGIASLGVEPTASTARASRERGVETIEEFFGVMLARRLVESRGHADLMAANNVLAHVPDINDFVAGFAILLASRGVATFEFPHLAKLVAQSQFDTIYHEHFSYLSLTAVARVFAANGLSVFDVQELATHGGSLRIFAQRSDSRERATEPIVQHMLDNEKAAGMTTAAYYESFQSQADRIKNEFLRFLLMAQSEHGKVAAYGAAAKGNTLLNYAGIRSDLLQCVADRNPAKYGRYMPGSRIPIVSEQEMRDLQPNYVVVLPWNLEDEVREQLSYVRGWGGKLVFAVPALRIE